MKKQLLLQICFTLLYASENEMQIGKKIFEKSCISCHSQNNSQKQIKNLEVIPKNLSKSILNEEQNYQIIKKGSKYWGSSVDIMPAFQSDYSDKELHSVAHYITQTFHPHTQQRVDKLYAQTANITSQQKKKMLQKGEQIYKRNCSWCHGITGNGDGIASKNPEKSLYPYDLRKIILTEKQIFLYAKYGGQYFGTVKNDMPSWSRKYDDFALKSVAKYIVEKFQNN